jgi:hypothetical protein
MKPNNKGKNGKTKSIKKIKKITIKKIRIKFNI